MTYEAWGFLTKVGSGNTASVLNRVFNTVPSCSLPRQKFARKTPTNSPESAKPARTRNFTTKSKSHSLIDSLPQRRHRHRQVLTSGSSFSCLLTVHFQLIRTVELSLAHWSTEREPSANCFFYPAAMVTIVLGSQWGDEGM